MFGVLLRARLRMLGNVARSVPGWQRGVVGGLSLFAVLLFLAVAAVSAALLLLAQGATPMAHGLRPAAASLVGRMEEYVFFFLLAGSVPFVAATLFQADDLPLLLSTPVPPRAVVGAKLLDAAAVNAAQFVVLGVPVLAGLGWGAHLSFVGWLWLLLSTLLMLVLPPAITAFCLLLAARVLGMRRVRLVVALISVALGLGITGIAVIGASQATRSGALDMAKLSAALHGDLPSDTDLSQQNVADSTPRWLPSAWAGTMLKETAGGQALGAAGWGGLGLLLASTVLFVGLCIGIGGRVFASEAFLEQDSGGLTAGPGRGLRLPGFSPAISGLLVKDTRYVARDLILLGQVGTALILFFVPFLLKIAQGSAAGADNDIYGGLALAMLTLMIYMVTSILSLTSVGLEGRSGWITFGSPMSRESFLQAKWLGAFGLSAGVVTVLFFVDWLVFAWGWTLAFSALVSAICACFALSGLGVGLSGLFPRFVYENPAHRASVWALILGFVFATTYLVLSLLIAGIAYWATTQGASVASASTLAVILFATLSLLTGLVPVILAQRRLEGYEWEF